jgi:hypothetical protein
MAAATVREDTNWEVAPRGGDRDRERWPEEEEGVPARGIWEYG